MHSSMDTSVIGTTISSLFDWNVDDADSDKVEEEEDDNTSKNANTDLNSGGDGCLYFQ